MQKGDLAARVIGLLVFALGIVILVFSFFIAYYGLFTSPTAGIAVQPSTPGGLSVSATLSRSALFVLTKIGALFIMVLVGSLIASRGIQVYFAGEEKETVVR